MAYTRCDVSSYGGLEVKAATGTPLIPNADYIRCEVCPNGLVCITYDWGENAYLLVSVSGGAEYVQHNLGPREAPNSHCPRWVASQNRCLVFKIYPEAGEYKGTYWAVGPDGVLHHIGAWDATGTGSMGIRDVSPQGIPQLLALTNIWPFSDTLPNGLLLLNWRERGDYVVGVMSDVYLGVVVYSLVSGQWYRAYTGNVDLLPGIDERGTVAANGADPGGFVEFDDWLTRPFDPHIDPIDPPDPVDPDPDPDPDPTPEKPMQRAVLVAGVWNTVQEEKHQDAGQVRDGYKWPASLIGARRITDGQLLKVRNDGTVQFEAGGVPGQDERLIPNPGGYYAPRSGKSVVIEAMGPWQE